MMKPLLLAALGTLAFACGSRAQDVTVTPPAWIDPSDAPDELPQFKHAPKADFPKSLLTTSQVGYVVFDVILSEKGKVLSFHPRPTLAQYDSALHAGPITFIPGRRAGKGVNTHIGYAVIYNPANAAENLPDSSPRLLEVGLAHRAGPKHAKNTPNIPDAVVEADVTVDENGSISRIADVPPDLASTLAIAAKNWRFSPARRAGKPTVATIRVPFVVVTDDPSETGKKMIPPRVTHQARPVYPLPLRAAGVRGEVMVGFDVSIEGRVTKAHIIHALNHSFDHPALAAVRQWEFEPGTVNGVPTVTSVAVPIIFDPSFNGSDGIETVQKGDPSKLPPEFRYDTAPVMTENALPIYPYAFVRDQVDGRAVVQFVINANGRVISSAVVEASSPEFGGALLAAVDTFKYEPAICAGKPTPTLLGFVQSYSITSQWALTSREDAALVALEKKHSPRILGQRDLDEPLKPTYQQPCMFPTCLDQTITSGKALVEFLVNEDGEVCLPRVISATAPAFGYAAVQSAASWYFETPRHGGKPAIVRVRVPFEFERTVPKAPKT